MNKKQMVEVEAKQLQRIAKYYQFPSAVFWGDSKLFRHKTRDESLRKKAELFDRIKEIVELE